ncbi:MAG TPA: protocatechuate 3,4-dioxygenase subunit alpha [Micromonosporaceae bacterium]|nr:protocatechuate 3,4-dioxygenase subunit alpha [Micromonosporaceae bacterium]
MTDEYTPSQTVGPFLAIGLPWPDGPDVVPAGSSGSFTITGRVLDGAGAPVADAMVETWQADPGGRFAHPDAPGGEPDPGFRGFGRSATDPDGAWHVRTVKPGRLPTRDGGEEAPHIDVSVFSRGLLDRVVTRIYFDDEDNSGDPVLASLDPDRRATLVAEAAPDGYRFDIVLQGDRETVFFDV